MEQRQEPAKAASLGRWLIPAAALLAVLLSASLKAEEPYTLGSGDRVRVTGYEQDGVEAEAQVAPDGTIGVPLLGRISVVGLTIDEASHRIGKRLEEEGYFRYASVNVIVEEYRSRTVAVLGAVNEPTRLFLDGPTTLSEALARAGGVSEAGGSGIVVIRVDTAGKQHREAYRIDQMLDSQAEGRSAVHVASGDTVFVPRSEHFFVRGNVQNPGRYPLRQARNVQEAIAVSGGFAAGANRDGLVIYRRAGDGSERQIEVDGQEQLRAGDVLVVEERLF
ncbi:polysaccharide biosynthesis/export family protein [Halorhodospira neutriphila]|uniref:Polysaccharide export protein n=1 Tax=Halorhodospira neutriphila TaxID=168379 RepID=A0ABS1E361_9GAMM|nr:polysaccharide biosynthesis/export family protein [Halorhodospira neutriphila]MBK1725915.1 hypothetical protein [Halorhodospira neutriphila]